MKTSTTNLLTQLSNKEMQTLTTQVAETLATSNNKKTFTSVDLWSIQKQRRSYGIRSFA